MKGFKLSTSGKSSRESQTVISEDWVSAVYTKYLSASYSLQKVCVHTVWIQENPKDFNFLFLLVLCEARLLPVVFMSISLRLHYCMPLLNIFGKLPQNFRMVVPSFISLFRFMIIVNCGDRKSCNATCSSLRLRQIFALCSYETLLL